MKIKATLIALALTMVISMFTSCSKSPKEMLTGEFKVTEITTDLKMSPEETENWKIGIEEAKKSTITLNADGTMQKTDFGVTEKGTWEVYGEEGEEGEHLCLKLIMENKATYNMEIHNLTSSGFVNIVRNESPKCTYTNTYTKVK